MQSLSAENVKAMLDKLYTTAVDGGIPGTKSVSEMGKEYLAKHKTPEKAAKAMLKNQIAKCATSGFVTGFGGLITLPIAVPANITSVLYVQMRAIACTAYMAGYDLGDDEVQTFVYACLAGVSVNAVVKKFGINFGNKLALNGVKKIPGAVLLKINKAVGFRFITKFGEKGLINMGKLVPVAGAVISGALDFSETKIIADRAYSLFIKGKPF